VMNNVRDGAGLCKLIEMKGNMVQLRLQNRLQKLSSYNFAEGDLQSALPHKFGRRAYRADEIEVPAAAKTGDISASAKERKD
jgi:hypothetical protein